MILYRHFALPNIFLVNGYKETQTEEGVEHEYAQEDNLEQCVRRLLLRNPKPLRGWDLRFLRNGIGLSQAEFGEMVDRDAQTIARWEKTSEPVPKFADVLIRIRFAERFEPTLEIKDVLGFVDGSARPLPKRITLTLGDKGWNFDLEPSIKVTRMLAHANTIAELPRGFGPTLKVHEGRSSTKPYLSRPDDLSSSSVMGSYLLLNIQSSQALFELSSDSTALVPFQENIFEDTRRYAH